MKNLADMKVSSIVAQNFRAARLFSEHGIDFCCNGGVSLTQACYQKGIQLDEVLKQLEQVLLEPYDLDYQGMNIKDLIAHIVHVHHHYIENTIPLISRSLNKICAVHGDNHPELLSIREIFDEGALSLIDHLKKEEKVLFPFIEDLANSRLPERDNGRFIPTHINSPVAMMEMEHNIEGYRYRRIAELSNHYLCPDDACSGYRFTYSLLHEFETDLHKHIHLENNILFPRAKGLFNALRARENRMSSSAYES